MSEKDLLIMTIVAIFVLTPVLYFMVFRLIPHWLNDNKWEKYMAAWDLWDKNGKKGVMPVPEDYDYKDKL